MFQTQTAAVHVPTDANCSSSLMFCLTTVNTVYYYFFFLLSQDTEFLFNDHEKLNEFRFRK